jgi:phenylacetic acid degradation operon negative regulatory protein
VLDVLSTLGERAAPVRFLVAVTAIFGIDANATRVAIARLLASGLLQRDERGAYRLSPAADPVAQRLRNWHTLPERVRPWDGTWLAAALALPVGSRECRSAAQQALEFSGMREFSSCLWIRPDNLEGGIEAARSSLVALGLPVGTPLFCIRDFDPACDERARGLWDTQAMRREYRAACAEMERSAVTLTFLEAREAMAESFLLGGAAIRRLVLDPLLPDELIPAAERKALVDATIRYNAVGRRCWAEFLARHGVVPIDPPGRPSTSTSSAGLGSLDEVLPGMTAPLAAR